MTNNEDRWYSIIYGYYKFYDTVGNDYNVIANEPLISSNELNNNDINLIIKRLANNIGHTVYMNIELDETIFINDKAHRSYQLVLQKEEN